MKKLLLRLAITLAILLVVLGGSWLAWRQWWAGDMLRSAIFYDEPEKVRTLLQLGVDPYPHLLLASTTGPETVKVLLNHGVDPNYRFAGIESRMATRPTIVYRNVTLLMNAADNGKADIVEVLLSSGADVTAVDDRGNSALHFLLLDLKVNPSHIDFVPEPAKLLLKAGADPELQNSDGKAPLDIWPELADIVEEVKGEKAGP